MATDNAPNFSIVDHAGMNDTSHDYGPVIVSIFVITMVIFIILAFIGNTLVILTVLRHKGMKTRTNMFIVNLAVADILVALFNMPFSLTTIIHGRWIFGEPFCQFNGFVVPLFFIVSIHTLMYISIHKYVSITRPFSQTMTQQKILVMIAAAWTWSAICSITTVKGGNHVLYKKGASQCGPSIPDELNEYIHSIMITTCNYIIPLIVMSYCYFHIFREIHEHMIRIRETSNVDLENSLAQQRRISCTLFLVLACFLTCWTPFIIYSCTAAFVKEKSKVPILANPVAYWCGYMNSACNPIIYALRSPSFRNGYKQILCNYNTYTLGGSLATRRSSSLGTLKKSFRRFSAGSGDRKASLPLQKEIRSPPPKKIREASNSKRRQPRIDENFKIPLLSRSSLQKDYSSHKIGITGSENNLSRHNKIHVNTSGNRRTTSLVDINEKCNSSSPKRHFFIRHHSFSSFVQPENNDSKKNFINRLDISNVNPRERQVIPQNSNQTNRDNVITIQTGADSGIYKSHDQPDFPAIAIESASTMSSLSTSYNTFGDITGRRNSNLTSIVSSDDALHSQSFMSTHEISPDKYSDGGKYSPSSIKSMEMGRSSRGNSLRLKNNINHAYEAFLERNPKLRPPQSPLYTASREQLMKWMSEDCLDRLGTTHIFTHHDGIDVSKYLPSGLRSKIIAGFKRNKDNELTPVAISDNEDSKISCA